MRTRLLLFVAAVVAGCAASAPPSADLSSTVPRSPLGSPFAAPGPGVPSSGWPVILDRTDLGLSTSVMFQRIPTVGEIHDLQQEYGFQHLVIVLPGWPTGPEVIEPLNQITEDTDAVVILPGYPPTRAAADAWNQLITRIRIVALVDGPPAGPGVLADLNTMRGLERVIAQMDRPSRAGFERLQRPLGFRKIME